MDGFLSVKIKELEGLPLVRMIKVVLLVMVMWVVGAFPLERMVKMSGFFPPVKTRREVWFSPLERMLRIVGAVPFERMLLKMVGAVPLLSMMKVVGDFPLVRTLRMVGAVPLLSMMAVVLVRLVSVSLKTEYSPGKSCVCSIRTSLI